MDMLVAMDNALAAVAADPAVRVVVIAGNGAAFSGGHDLKEMMANRSEPFIGALFEQCSRVMLQLQGLPQPVIARVHGTATAAGCQLVAACDLAVAASEARFATSGINFGLFCATPGVPLSRNVSQKRAFEMLFTGEFIDAETAREWDWSTAWSPRTNSTRRWHGWPPDRGEAACRRRRGQGALLRTARGASRPGLRRGEQGDHPQHAGRGRRRGVGAFIEKRKPNWPS